MSTTRPALSLSILLTAGCLASASSAWAQEQPATQPAGDVPATQEAAAEDDLAALVQTFQGKAIELQRLVPEPAVLLAEQSRTALRDQVLPVTGELLDLTHRIEAAAAKDPQVPANAIRAQMQTTRRQVMAIQVAFGDEKAEADLASQRGREPQASLLLGRFIAAGDLQGRSKILDESVDFVRVETQSPTTVNFVAGLFALTRTLDAELQTKVKGLIDLLEGPLAEQLRKEVEAEDALRNADDTANDTADDE